MEQQKLCEFHLFISRWGGYIRKKKDQCQIQEKLTFKPYFVGSSKASDLNQDNACAVINSTVSLMLIVIVLLASLCLPQLKFLMLFMNKLKLGYKK